MSTLRIAPVLLLALAIAGAPAAWGQAYPAKPIRLVAPSTPGDAPDVIARLVADKLSAVLGQQVIVENRPGAGGVVGSEHVAKSPPDGYTLIMGNAGSHGINAAVYSKLPYDIQRDFAPVSQVAIAPNIVVINPAVPATSVAEFIAYAKREPGKLSYASGGNGSSAHMSMELFKSMAGIDVQHVPYKGSSPALTDLIGGQVAIFIGNMPPTVPHVKAGKLRALAVTTKSRSALMPELPTISEAGLPGFETVAWFGVLAPAGTPPEIVNRLSIEIGKIARSPEMREKLLAMGAEPVGGTPEEFKAVIDRDIAKWKPLAQKVGIKVDSERLAMTAIAALEPIVVNVSPKTNWSFIAVTTADGAVGWGECSLNGWEPLLMPQAQMLARDAIGRDLDAVGDLVRYLPHSPGGLIAHAVKSAAEQALVDLRARGAGKSIAAVLSTAPRRSIPAYANINRGVSERSPGGFATAAQRAVAAGYRAIKLAPFDGVVAEDAAHTPIAARTRAGLDRVFAVRDAVGPEVAVMVDCHWRFDVARAEAMLADIAAAKPYWVECMVSEHPASYPAIARLTALAHERGLRTAGGEMIAGTDQAQAMCAANAYDVLMPDIKYAGGYAGMLAIAQVCADHGVAYAPHNPTGPIAHLASIHACAAAPALRWLEHQWNESPLFYSLVGADVAPLVDGGFAVPTTPGLGAALDRAVAIAHPEQPLAKDANLDERLG